MSAPQPFHPFEVDLAGRNVVDASAGTGKTYAITSLVVRLLLERRLRVRDCLVVTFTEAATSELRDRVRKRLREACEAFAAVEMDLAPAPGDLALYALSRKAHAASDRLWLELALEEVDEAPISTIHGFCHRVLQEAALESGVAFETDLVADARPMRDEAVFDFYSRDLAAQPVEDARAIVDGTVLALWRGLADKVFRSADAAILPRQNDERQQAWAAAIKQLCGCWVRKDVEALLLSHPGLTPKFQAKKLNEWCGHVESILTVGGIPTDVPRGVLQLCATALQARAKAGKPPGHEAFAALDTIAALVRTRQEAGAASVVAAKRRFVDFLRNELPQRKQAAGTITFDDLLLRLRDALRGASGARLAAVVRKQFRAALIDEFQDTDPVQFAIFEALFANIDAPVFLIGDPKQAIYGFRGADVNAYLQAVNASGSRHHTMGVNWRSDPSLVRAINTLFAPRPELSEPFMLAGIKFHPVKPRPAATDVFEAVEPDNQHALDVLLVPEGLDEAVGQLANLVAADISRLLAGAAKLQGKLVVPADVAVLTRTNDQAIAVQKALRRLQIPAVLLGDKSVLDSLEAKELTTVLAAIVEPTHAGLMRRALATQLMGLSSSNLVNMETDAAASSTWSERFRQWHQVWTEQGFVPMFRRWLEHETVQGRLLGLVDGERRVTNLLHLMELIHRAARENHLGPAGVLHWLAQAPRDAEGGVAADEAQIRLESDEAAVKLTTVHRSKGLEYPIVYCPFVTRDFLLIGSDAKLVRFHDEDGNVALDLGSKDLAEHQNQARREALAENIRLLYVALTRARHRCTIVWGHSRSIKESALAALLYPLRGRDADDNHWECNFLGSLGKLDEARLRAPIDAWRSRSEGAVGIRVPSLTDEGVRYCPATSSAPLLPAREVQSRIESWQRTTSFSAMTASAGSGAAMFHAQEVARDRDAASNMPEVPDVVQQDVPLAEFPRGAKAGNFFHELLETADFATDAAGLAPAVAAQLSLYRYPEQPWQQAVPEALVRVLATPLTVGKTKFALRELPARERIAELEFALPLGGQQRAEGLELALARVFALEAETAAERHYADRVRQLHLGTLQGFLRGFIDLVFLWQGRFYVVDYKTNHLGRSWQHYKPEALEQAMLQGHYFLQSHLYALAVHRHLQRTVADYSYDTKFGGVFYLFLRGMNGRSNDSGVFFHRPPAARMNGLELLFAQPKVPR